jgi:hypothetical protein
MRAAANGRPSAAFGTRTSVPERRTTRIKRQTTKPRTCPTGTEFKAQGNALGFGGERRLNPNGVRVGNSRRRATDPAAL